MNSRIALAAGIALGTAAMAVTGAALQPAPTPTPEPVAVTAPATDQNVVVVDAPSTPIAQDTFIITPATPTEEAPPVDVPALCPEGLIPVEDGSCVDPSFFDEPEVPIPALWFEQIVMGPCQNDDGTPYPGADACIWDAQVQGNGQGTSFVSYNGQIFTLAGN